MLTQEKQKEYYQALINKKTEYDGVFFVGIKTTGIFCRPSCPARKPKIKNCEFFSTAQQALLASFRPCKRCQPLSHPHHTSKVIQILVDAVERNPEKRWKNRDFKQLSIEDTTARRQFKKRFGMTFVEYARARRMGLAIKQIRKGESIIDTQLATGYESSSGFRDAFSRIMGAAPTRSGQSLVLKASWLDTPLGPMLAIADEKALYLLEFIDRRGLEREVELLRRKAKAVIIPGSSKPIESIEAELKQYFKGILKEFKTSIIYLGSSFQKCVWEELRKFLLEKFVLIRT
jgi:AraC family transcriptional regulator, regulatory protein of adaptative response / methylated-DNA-[protein]-cysteine methyltransferase